MIRMIIRFIVSALVLMFVGFLVPGFSVNGFTGALIAAIVIAILGYIVERLMGREVSPQSHGIVGFLTAAIVIYVAKWIVPGAIQTSILGALLAAFVVGLIDAVIPTTIR